MPWENGAEWLRNHKITLKGSDFLPQETFTNEFSHFSKKLKVTNLQDGWVQAHYEGDNYFDKCDSKIVHYKIEDHGDSDKKISENDTNMSYKKDDDAILKVKEEDDSVVFSNMPLLSDTPTDIDNLGRDSVAFVISKRLNEIWINNRLKKIMMLF